MLGSATGSSSDVGKEKQPLLCSCSAASCDMMQGCGDGTRHSPADRGVGRQHHSASGVEHTDAPDRLRGYRHPQVGPGRKESPF